MRVPRIYIEDDSLLGTRSESCLYCLLQSDGSSSLMSRLKVEKELICHKNFFLPCNDRITRMIYSYIATPLNCGMSMVVAFPMCYENISELVCSMKLGRDLY